MITENANRVELKNAFEEEYLALRKKEGRLFTDDEVTRLPDIAGTHPLKKEWGVRKASCRRLVEYLVKKQKALTILEVGCGNGWLSNQLSHIEGAVVTGLDINSFELEQAVRVFGRHANLRFVQGDLREEALDGQNFDILVFAASIQYFSSLPQIMEAAFGHLKKDGEIHIMDSRFYDAKQIGSARRRSEQYFSRLGFQKMSGFYFHHSIDDLIGYNRQFLFDPDKTFNKLFRRNNPFQWICIQHS